MHSLQAHRRGLLQQWAAALTTAAHGGALDRGRPLQLLTLQLINGPRAGAVLAQAGVQAGRLLRTLTADDAALARQLIPFDFAGEPSVYMQGRWVRLEVGWPDALAERDIRLSALGARPHGAGRWVVGRNEQGRAVVAGVHDSTAHWLVSGATGAGKSVALRSAVAQLAAAGDTQLVLIDGKGGESLGSLRHVCGQVGPLALDPATAREALAWTAAELRRRYAGESPRERLVVVVDEVQELVEDALIAECLRRLAAQGRAAGIHLLLGTQHPTVDALGDGSVKRNVVGRLALHVTDAEASRAAIGAATPRADHLLDRGDAFVCVPGQVHRTQVAVCDWPPDESGAPIMDAWPSVAEGDSLGRAPEGEWSPGEIGSALIAAHHGHGRPRLQRALVERGLPAPGSERARRLLSWGREILGWLGGQGYTVAPACLPEADSLSEMSA